MSLLIARCRSCGSHEALFELGREVHRGDKITPDEFDRLRMYQNEPCSGCGEPLRGSTVDVDE